MLPLSRSGDHRHLSGHALAPRHREGGGIKTIPVGDHPEGIDADPSGGFVYVACSGTVAMSLRLLIWLVTTARLPASAAA